MQCGINGGAAPNCIPELIAIEACFTHCATSAVILGGDTGACMTHDCPAAYANLNTCLNEVYDQGACATPLAACGITL